LFGPGHLTVVRQIEVNLAELRAAYTWAVVHDRPLAVRLVGGMVPYVEHRMSAEIAAWAQRVLAEIDRCAPEEIAGGARVLAVAAAGDRFSGRLDRARELAERGLRVTADPATEAYLRLLLCEVSLFEGNPVEAQRQADVIGPLANQGGMEPLGRIGRLSQPLLLAYGGDVAGAAEQARDLYAEAVRAAEPVVVAWAEYTLGEVLVDTEPARAQGLLSRALRAA